MVVNREKSVFCPDTYRCKLYIDYKMVIILVSRSPFHPILDHIPHSTYQLPLDQGEEDLQVVSSLLEL
jgi:hypothetical protein